MEVSNSFLQSSSITNSQTWVIALLNPDEISWQAEETLKSLLTDGMQRYAVDSTQFLGNIVQEDC